jgi:hypothetical protein
VVPPWAKTAMLETWVLLASPKPSALTWVQLSGLGLS